MTEQQATGAENPQPTPPEGSTPPTGSGAPPEEPKTFDAEYVKSLRDEAAKHRNEKKASEEKAQALSQRLLDQMVKSSCTELADPGDLLAWVAKEDLLGEDGLPDEEKILAAQSDLLERKPHLRTRDARGDIDQGGRGGEVDSFSFNDWLKSHAS